MLQAWESENASGFAILVSPLAEGRRAGGLLESKRNLQGARAESAGYAAVVAVARSGWVVMYVGLDCSFVIADIA